MRTMTAVDDYHWFSKGVFDVRDDVQRVLGDSYSETIRPITALLREDAVRLNISVLKAFERAATPLLDKTDNPVQLLLLMAAVAELYLLRGEVFSGIGQG